jgi:hypothetical protein
MTQIDGTTSNSRTNEILGLCVGDDNPDAWFPESPQGAASHAKMQALGLSVSRAIILCKACPRQEACLAEGMLPKNLPYGIWGGKLAGERLLLADAQGIKYMAEGRRTSGAYHREGTAERVGRGRHKGVVVIREPDTVTVEEKRTALNFLRRIRPWIRG